jgi:hypothetical protein
MQPNQRSQRRRTAQRAAREAWRSAKAEADRLYWKLCRDRVNARRRERYRNDGAYRERVRARRTRRPAQASLRGRTGSSE